MAKSIEKIWQEGFMNSDALIAPKLNSLYERKSQHIIDKLMRMGKHNLIGLAVMAFVLLFGSILLGVPYTGTVIFILLAIALVFGVKRMEEMKQLDSSLDSYEYLKSFDNFLKETIAGYTRMYRFVYPALTLAIFQGTWSLSGFREHFMAGSAHAYLVNGVPAPVLVGVIFIASLTALFAGTIYRIDVNFFYGRVFKKLNEILTDMEELRK